MTNHSARGDTLFIIIKRLEEAKIPYQLTAYPGYGYEIKGIDKLDFME